MEFRVHHILCTQLYRGMGYDGTFCENMTAIVTRLRQAPDEELTLVCHADAICQNCPNRQENDFCTNGGAGVCSKDRALLVPMHLEEGGRYSYRRLLEQSEKYMTMEIFTKSCQNCQWYSFCRTLISQYIRK